jgi:hypothetical protein
MSWFKVDDKLHDHRKARKAGKAAMGVWVLAASWSTDNDQDGFVPCDVLSRWGTPADARRLVAAGFWRETTHKGEPGWRFHDWARFQPSAAVTAAKRAKEAEAGLRGNHKRWHADRGITDPDCEYCYRVPDREPDGVPDSPPNRGLGDSPPIPPVPEPDPTTTSNEVVGVSEPRADVLRVCEYLADAIEGNGSKRPTVGKGWQDDARKMLDLDGRTEAEVIKAIDWCQRGESDRAVFWRPNVMSMNKLRAKFDVMRLQAAAESRQTTKPTRVQEHWSLVQQLAAEEAAQTLPEIGQRR